MPLMITDCLFHQVRMLRGEDMQQYFTSFLTAEQAEFMQAVLTTKAAPRKEAFPPITASIRRSLGPADKFYRDHLEALGGKPDAKMHQCCGC